MSETPYPLRRAPSFPARAFSYRVVVSTTRDLDSSAMPPKKKESHAKRMAAQVSREQP
jgi:hypothetical protein